jgi:uncharacterized iron-regulated membrane protein
MLSTNTLKAWLFVHKWTSLVCTVFLLLLCVTGLPLIFWHEIEHALPDHVEPPPMPADAPRVSLDTIVATARLERPSDALQYIGADDQEMNIWYVGMGETADAPEVSVFYTFDARTGAILEAWSPGNSGVMDVIFRLHYDLFAGLPGTLLLGAMGLLFVVALISGVVVYGPFMRKLPFGVIRNERSTRTRWLDLHNLLGIAAFLWLFVVGATGVINALAVPIFAHWQNTELAGMIEPYRNRAPLTEFGSADRALAAASDAMPDMELSFMAFPGNDFAGPHHYVAYMRGATPLTSKLLRPLLIDARSGDIVDTREMPWYVSALLLSQPLHFGDYGGLPLKILWAFLNSIAIVVLGSGLYLWLKKRNVSLDARLAALRTGWDDRNLARRVQATGPE